MYNSTMLKLSDYLSQLKGVGPALVSKLEKFGIKTIKDLLWHFPFRYEDFSQVSKISDLKIGETATVQGVISDIKLKKTWKRKMFIVEALISDETGSIRAVWFNQRFLLSILKKGRLVNLAGKVTEASKGGIRLTHPVYELVSAQTVADDASTNVESLRESSLKHTGRLASIYPETKKLTSKTFRFLIKPILDNLEKIEDPVPPEILNQYNFPEINEALYKVHFPGTLQEARLAKKRFAFEDLLLLRLVNLRQRLKLSRQKTYSFEMDVEYVKSLFAYLPFELTQSQKKGLLEILKDLAKPQPMNRLLQGDVGSGKTIVAALAALVAAKGNKQSAFMAPTEILTRQHYQTFKKFFSNFDKGVGLIVSKEARIFYGGGLENDIKKSELLKKISGGEIKIVFGTHALIQKNVGFNNLALVVIDEQHRFGVKQRAELLKNKESNIPHFLSMSATPIPRTLTLTIFGDLDLSIIDELPKGRKKIITKIVAPANREKAYDFIRGQIKKGRQIFVICPRIEPASQTEYQFQEVLEVRAVKQEYEKLAKKIFPDLKVAMLHGKMKVKEKTEVMNNFKNGEIDILVSTSVVEVGVDIPNATIMMIEGSERFGLAQLYQFRGRVGRGEYQSFCFLFTDSSSKITSKRLNFLLEAKNGFELAEKDLIIRGPGEFLGQSQTGRPDLAMKAIQNPELIKLSQEAAKIILKEDEKLEKHSLLDKRLEEFEKEIHLE